MSDSAITVADLKKICRQAATAPKAGADGFRPTANQTYFFTLVWLLKKKLKEKLDIQQAADLLAGQETAAMTGHARQVAQHLGEWGATVTGLKQRDEKEWELLRIQMEKAVRYYPCQPEGLKADALQEALFKVLILLDKMFDGHKLDETNDIVALVVDARSALTNIYDFGSPFYAFAKRIARNELITRLRKEGRELVYLIPLEDVTHALPSVSPPQSSEEDDEALSQTLLQLKIDLNKLLEVFQHHLTPKPRQVIFQTFAARPQFWQALSATGLAPPEGMPPQTERTTDAEIAQALGTTENNVRVHRTNAKKQVQEIDPILGLLFEGLITRGGGSAAGKEWKARSGG